MKTEHYFLKVLFVIPDFNKVRRLENTHLGPREGHQHREGAMAGETVGCTRKKIVENLL